jgi:hypothetical protein
MHLLLKGVGCTKVLLMHGCVCLLANITSLVAVTQYWLLVVVAQPHFACSQCCKMPPRLARLSLGHWNTCQLSAMNDHLLRVCKQVCMRLMWGLDWTDSAGCRLLRLSLSRLLKHTLTSEERAP